MTFAQTISTRAKAIFAVAFTVLVLSFSSPVAFAQNPAAATPQQAVTQVQDEVRGVLSQYGRFVQHQKYGEVWVPTVTPQGWHPYPPCNWVNTRQYGWYYDDKTPWGQIVHHYGRWVHDAEMGWIWTPGAEFSPAWVVWRSSPQWVGWAPMLPDEDVQTISTADFNNAAYWIFVETQKFAQGCNPATVAPPTQIPVLLTQTTFVTDIQLVGGITVFILPQYIVGPLIDIDIFFSPWPTWFLAQTLIDWNFMWNNFVIVNVVVYQNCPPQLMKQPQAGGPKPQPINNPPPPPPPPGPGRPIESGPPIIAVTPVCPYGTVLSDGACRLADPCRGGTVRIGNACVLPVRPEPLPTPQPGNPPVRVINNPCANLSGGEFQRCIRGTPPNTGGDTKPNKGPIAGTGDLKPVGNRPGYGDRPAQNPVGGSLGVGNPASRNPNVTFHPNGPRLSDPPKYIRGDSSPPVNRLPATSVTPIRSNPNPVVLGPGGGGFNRGLVGSTATVSHNAVASGRTLPVALPRQGPVQKQTIVR